VCEIEKNASDRDVFSGPFRGETFRQFYRPQIALGLSAENPEQIVGKIEKGK